MSPIIFPFERYNIGIGGGQLTNVGAAQAVSDLNAARNLYAPDHLSNKLLSYLQEGVVWANGLGNNTQEAQSPLTSSGSLFGGLPVGGGVGSSIGLGTGVDGFGGGGIPLLSQPTVGGNPNAQPLDQPAAVQARQIIYGLVKPGAELRDPQAQQKLDLVRFLLLGILPAFQNGGGGL